MLPAKQLKRRLKHILLAATAAFMLAPSSSYATDTLDISTGLKTLLLMNDKPSGTIPVAIVYDPNNAESRSDADNIKSSIDRGIGVPSGLSINAYLVSADDPRKLGGAKVAFLAKDINANRIDSVCNIAGGNGVLTISTNINCVRSNKCILAIVSKPRVEIYYSPVAAEVSHISFAPAFIMLVKQL